MYEGVIGAVPRDRSFRVCVLHLLPAREWPMACITSSTPASHCGDRCVRRLVALRRIGMMVFLLVAPARSSWLFEGSLAVPVQVFEGSFEADGWGYCLQFNTLSARHGVIVRFSLADFATVQVLSLTERDSELSCFVDGLRHSSWGYVVPYLNPSGLFGKVVRFDLGDFATVEVSPRRSRG